LECLKNADRVYFLSADPLTEYWLSQLHPGAQSLNRFYSDGKDRAVTYEEIIQTVLEAVDGGLRVCFATYGHPGVFAYPTHEAIRRARTRGHFAEMLPAISADACLFADLGVDPSSSGCQSFEATDFLIYRRRFDPRSTLLLWQVGVIAVSTHKGDSRPWNRNGLRVLTERLLEYYPAEHQVWLYEAAPYACCRPRAHAVGLSGLPHADFHAIATLYVPPLGRSEADQSVIERLLESEDTTSLS
jgi:uncharacterized protein YabN with tetrapyrrole methylase and pyrophosphatase domain